MLYFNMPLLEVEVCVAAIGVMHFSVRGFGCALFIYKGEIAMPDYKAMYFELFNSVTEAVEILCDAQKKAEEIYINSAEEYEKQLTTN